MSASNNNSVRVGGGAFLGFGTLTSVMGNRIYDVACNIILSDLGGKSSLYTAIYQSSETLIAVLISTFGGVFSDRAKDKKRISPAFG